MQDSVVYSAMYLCLCANSHEESHCKYIYMYKPIQARVNTVAIPTTGKCCSLYWELLHPILGIPLASIGKLLFIGKLPIEA